MASGFIYELRMNIGNVELPNRSITAVTIGRNFSGARLPAIVVYLNLDDDLYNNVVSLAKDNRIDVALDIFYSPRLDAGSSVGRRQKFLNKTYLGLLDSNVRSVSKETERELNQGSTASDRGVTQRLRVALFDKRDLQGFANGVTNIVTTNPLLSDLLLYTFQRCSKGLSIRMSPPDKTVTVKGTFVMPPLGFYQAIDYIDQYCGIYETQHVLYTEDGCTYLLNTENDSRSTKEDELDRYIYIRGLSQDSKNPFLSEYEYDKDKKVHKYYVDEKNLFTPKAPMSDVGTTGETYVYGDEFTGNKHEMSHSVEVKTGQTGRQPKKKRTLETLKVSIDDLPVKVKPFTIVMVFHPPSGKYKPYRIKSILQVIKQNAIVTTLELYRTV
ncbi:MAG: hypothetical protein ACRC92_25835 [Peptostreptococcaceae bacterium]